MGGPSGVRELDHREMGGTLGMQELQAQGYARVDLNSGLIDLQKAPTEDQIGQIYKMIQANDGYVAVDLQQGLGDLAGDYYRDAASKFSQEYPAGTKPQKIVNDIRNFFRQNPAESGFRMTGKQADYIQQGLREASEQGATPTLGGKLEKDAPW